jgi:iron-sulfur cluster repair protein YtfE (RIC family)
MTESCGCGRGHEERRPAVAGRSGRYVGDERVADVARDPAARVVLDRFGLNHCCGGHLSLREGAAAAGAEFTALLRALEDVTERAA